MPPTTISNQQSRRAIFDALPEGSPVQLIGGELVREPSPLWRHQRSQIGLGTALFTFVRQNDLGEVVFAPFDVELEENDVYQPDIIVISNERKHIIRERCIEGAPDLVVEILSPSTGRYDLGRKKEMYARHGVREYWIVDPKKLTIEVHLNAGESFECFDSAEGAGTARSRLLNGFRADLRVIFPD